MNIFYNVLTFSKSNVNFDYEQRLISDPTDFNLWLRYLQQHRESSSQVKDLICERMLKVFPMSYKMWSMYIDRKVSECDELNWDAEQLRGVENVFESCLAFMNKVIEYIFSLEIHRAVIIQVYWNLIKPGACLI